MQIFTEGGKKNKKKNTATKTSEKSLSWLARYQCQISKHEELLKFPAVIAEKHMRQAED